MPLFRVLLTTALVLAALTSTAAAAPAPIREGDPVWSAIAGRLPLQRAGAVAEITAKAYSAFTVQGTDLRDLLAGAPLEGTAAARRELPVVRIPAPDGTLQRFRFAESPVMEQGLADRHPDIRTYAGTGIDDPTATVRFDLTPLGFHASVRSARGAWYVDPYYHLDPRTYVSYFTRDATDQHGGLKEPEGMIPEDLSLPAPARRAAGDAVVRRTYRLALASDDGYAKYFGADPILGTGGNTTAAKVTLVNRVNQIYNDDLAIRLVLIADNDMLNFNTATFNALYPGVTATAAAGQGGCGAQTLVQNQAALTAVVGPDSYDIGHIALGLNGGGIAFLGVVGNTAQKAGGCTGIPTPVGDFFAIDYVAHEMGHQFGGPHTFSGNQGSCSGNGTQEAGVEPGSGSSVMAYAGICGVDDLQPHTDPYFSQQTIDDITTYVTTPPDMLTPNNGGFTQTTTTNHVPSVTAPSAATIPIRTPFTLTGSGTDVDGDPLVYLWEQNDTAPERTLPDNARGTAGPLFRVFGTFAGVSPADAIKYESPGENLAFEADRTRTFPDPAQIASGNTNAASGTCPTPAAAATTLTPLIRDCFSEFLPTAPRTMAFRLTARDRYLDGGGTNHADETVTVAGTAPFRVTSQPAPASVAGGSTQTVLWDVAGTTAAPFNAPQVSITYSTDGGLTFPVTLVASTANDGSADVVLPDTATTGGRFKVQPVGAIFFDVSRGNLTVTPATPTTTTPTTPTTPATTTTTPATTTTTPATTTTTPETTPATTTPATTTTTPGATSTVPGAVTTTPGTTTTVPGTTTLPAARGFSSSVAVDRTLRTTVRTKGLRVRLRCSAACSFTVQLRVDTATVKALGLKSRTIGTATQRFTAAGRRTIQVRLTSAARAVLTRRAAQLSVRAAVSSAGGSSARTVKVVLAGR